VSPLLPIALVVGQTMAAGRLREVGVFCLNPSRIAISGKIRVCCFDKTGTLTKVRILRSSYRGIAIAISPHPPSLSKMSRPNDVPRFPRPFFDLDRTELSGTTTEPCEPDRVISSNEAPIRFNHRAHSTS
jgi:hypothetical protein